MSNLNRLFRTPWSAHTQCVVEGTAMPLIEVHIVFSSGTFEKAVCCIIANGN